MGNKTTKEQGKPDALPVQPVAPKVASNAVKSPSGVAKAGNGKLPTWA